MYTKISELVSESERSINTEYIVTGIGRLICETYLKKGTQINHVGISDEDATVAVTRNEIPELIEYLQTLYDMGK